MSLRPSYWVLVPSSFVFVGIYLCLFVRRTSHKPNTHQTKQRGRPSLGRPRSAKQSGLGRSRTVRNRKASGRTQERVDSPGLGRSRTKRAHGTSEITQDEWGSWSWVPPDDLGQISVREDPEQVGEPSVLGAAGQKDPTERPQTPKSKAALPSVQTRLNPASDGLSGPQATSRLAGQYPCGTSCPRSR